MALLGFPDGSYIELISTLEPGQAAPWWDRPIALDGGPCAWAVGNEDLAGEARRLLGLNVLVRGPAAFNRQRPDGVRVEWELLFLNQGDPGSVLPFLIQDRTPRELRAAPAPVEETPGSSHTHPRSRLSGVRKVVLGVFSTYAWSELFRRMYGWDLPVTAEDETFGARLSIFPGQPVILAQPLGPDSWLTRRLNRFGELPCAFLIGSRDLERSRGDFPLGETQSWSDLRLAWFDPSQLNGARLGIVDLA